MKKQVLQDMGCILINCDIAAHLLLRTLLTYYRGAKNFLKKEKRGQTLISDQETIANHNLRVAPNSYILVPRHSIGMVVVFWQGEVAIITENGGGS